MESAGVTLCSLSDMCYPLPREPDKVQNWHSFYKDKFGFLRLCFALDLSQAASSRHVSSAVFAMAAPTLVPQGNAGGDWKVYFCFDILILADFICLSFSHYFF